MKDNNAVGIIFIPVPVDKQIIASKELVLTYSPIYESIRSGHEMTYRILRSDFVSIDSEITYYAKLRAPSS